ncbi:MULTISPECIES: major capsid protein [Acinetobacter]|uniref:major capsid protein n=1 Tax=Acinetobacter TaxID=469 RepID=UPI0015D13359|nr:MULTISPECIES: major capsid protein [Acinetobacter]MCO8060333.1 major capsid protein [Acinetobacter towneri]MCO8065983.1 major capsid protein [Acinetobacter towneri]
MDHLTQDQVNDAMTKTYGNRKNFMIAVKKYGLGAAVSAALVTNANAAEIDVSSVVGTITDGVTTVSAIGLAVLSLVVVIKVFKWARSAM